MASEDSAALQVSKPAAAPQVSKPIATPEVSEPMATPQVSEPAPALPDGSPKSPPANNENKPDDEPEKEDSWEALRRKIPLRVDVEWLDFEHFKNRYSETEGLAIIEVLCGHPRISQEVSRETMIRARVKRDIRVTTPMPKLSVDGDSSWIQRVRIQSPQLILLLSRLMGHRDKWTTDQPYTFFTPFRAFYLHFPQLKQSLKLLEAKWAAPEAPASSQTEAESERKHEQLGDNTAIDTSSGGDEDEDEDEDEDDDAASDPDLRPMPPHMAVSEELIDSPITLAHLRKFVDFVEKHVVSRWQRAAGTTHRKFRLSDLQMAFQPGELLYVSPSSDSPQNSAVAQNSSPKMYQSIWRLYAVTFNSIDDEKPDDTHKVSKRNHSVFAYYMDYDGNSYVPVRHDFIIKSYEGERDIASLNIYPLRFVKDAEKTKATFREQGTRFRQVVTQKHLAYDGWTLASGPTGDSEYSPKPLAVEHIDGDVMIDFVDGYKSRFLADHEPQTQGMPVPFDEDDDWLVGDDSFWIKHWRPVGTSAQLETFADIKERMVRAEWFTERQRKEHVKSRAVLKAYENGTPIKEADLDEDDLLLLPRRVVAYAFRERRFVMLDVRSLKNLPTTDDVFSDLQIDPSHKMMVTSLVKSHLDKQAAQRLRPSASLNQDLIRGKGAGLVILLHGVPGVGKTATAEAVAQANKKPLFAITCGDLGFTPTEVEESLKDIFRLAHNWDCVLLLDEADIFLSRRELGDLKRNALVSVFLRVLEYYSGILFLTTNRVGTLDEAFKSRIHVSLYYPPLSLRQTIEIFGVNLRKLQRIVDEKHKLQEQLEPDTVKRFKLIIDTESILDYAGWHYDANKVTWEQRWNGRQIRNAFQIAYSLVEFDTNVSDQGNGVDDQGTILHPGAGDGRLDYRQFQMVANAIANFEDYLQQATHGTDADRARTSFTRDDEYDHRQSPQRPTYNPPAYQRPLRGSRMISSDRRSDTAPNPPLGHYRSQQDYRPAQDYRPSQDYRPQFQPSQAARREYQPPNSARREEQHGQPAPGLRNQYRPNTNQQAQAGRPQQMQRPLSSPGGPVPRLHPNAGGPPPRGGTPLTPPTSGISPTAPQYATPGPSSKLLPGPQQEGTAGGGGGGDDDGGYGLYRQDQDGRYAGGGGGRQYEEEDYHQYGHDGEGQPGYADFDHGGVGGEEGPYRNGYQ
ncbi:hypothetical protein C8A00DRAFT_32743 [Chaetomidium leptoderma]|uniref:AAA+ ATPase domain-containing protein n=1 Tax=Chaetomidium leptoderma TaxID=669021 RepID=A0AAN6ZXH0_9PEZI|nr:hypothetical protein C8A00DRAFT_32743 [Chaetomidium leptoderma]